MAEKASATVQMDENGRVTIPKSTRLALGLEGESAYLDLDIRPLDQDGDSSE